MRPQWHVDELIPSRFTIVDVKDDRCRITPCHVRDNDVVAFPMHGVGFNTLVKGVDGLSDEWIGVPRRQSLVQTTEEWYVGFHEQDDRPFEWSNLGDYGEWRGRTLFAPITHVRNLMPGQEGVIVGAMYVEDGLLAG